MSFRFPKMLSTSAAAAPRIGEIVFGWLILAFLAVQRYRLTSRLRVDSDEPQHLHVVWGWTRGLLPFRDQFDNHAPLFHLLYAPLMSRLGERPDILTGMRLAEFPIFFGSLWAIYALGKTVFDRRTAWWAMLFTGCEATFFFTSIEFRPDTLWALFWLIGLLLLLKSEGRMGRMLLAGLMLGATVCTSTKTAVLLLGFGLATIGWLILHRLLGGSFSWKKIVPPMIALGLGTVVPPAALAGYFWKRGGLKEMVYCLFEHNVASAGSLHRWEPKMLFFPIASGIALAAARWIFRKKDDGGLAFRPTFLLLGSVFFCGLMVSYWSRLTPLTRQNFLPVLPIAMLFGAAGIVWLAPRLGRLGAVPIVLVLVLFGVQWRLRPEGNNTETGSYRHYLELVLALTEPDDYVMDSKGESVFRRRPYYFVLETQTRRKLMAGTLPDIIPNCLVSTQTPLTRINRLPPEAAKFVHENYLDIGKGAFVLGKKLTANTAEPEKYPFTVAVAGRYGIVGQNQAATGSLNGRPLTGAIDLEPGEYIFVRSSAAAPLVLLLTKAIEQRDFPVEEKEDPAVSPAEENDR